MKNEKKKKNMEKIAFILRVRMNTYDRILSTYKFGFHKTAQFEYFKPLGIL